MESIGSTNPQLHREKDHGSPTITVHDAHHCAAQRSGSWHRRPGSRSGQTQNESARLQREVQMENPNVSLEETMVAIQKAQIGFQATLHVRNRMVQAYTDIMNMQV